jgi:hypothetical protein
MFRLLSASCSVIIILFLNTFIRVKLLRPCLKPVEVANFQYHYWLRITICLSDYIQQCSTFYFLREVDSWDYTEVYMCAFLLEHLSPLTDSHQTWCLDRSHQFCTMNQKIIADTWNCEEGAPVATLILKWKISETCRFVELVLLFEADKTRWRVYGHNR